MLDAGTGTSGPLLIPKRPGRIADGLDDMIISLYARGMSVRDILHHLEQIYGSQLSAETVSRITDQVLEEARVAVPAAGPGVYRVVSARPLRGRSGPAGRRARRGSRAAR